MSCCIGWSICNTTSNCGSRSLCVRRCISWGCRAWCLGHEELVRMAREYSAWETWRQREAAGSRMLQGVTSRSEANVRRGTSARVVVGDALSGGRPLNRNVVNHRALERLDAVTSSSGASAMQCLSKRRRIRWVPFVMKEEAEVQTKHGTPAKGSNMPR